MNASRKILLLEDGETLPTLRADLSARGFTVCATDLNEVGIDLGTLPSFAAIIISPLMSKADRVIMLRSFQIAGVKLPIFTGVF